MKKGIKSELKIFFIITLFVFGLFIKNDIFAISNYSNDCLEVFDKDSWDNESVLPKTDLEIAINNLQTYCCSLNSENNYCIDLEKSEVYPDSPYLFDHIVDIGLRRLDAESNGSYDGMSFDEKGKEWRTKLDEIANSKDGYPPIVLKTYFDDNFKFNYVFDGEVLSNYSSYSIYDRYNNWCKISKYIYDKLVPNSKILEMQKDSKIIKACEEITNNRIQAEILYVKTLMMEKANSILDDNIQVYTKDYFVKQKMMALADSFNSLVDYLGKTFKGIGKGGTSTCSK